MQFRKDFDYDAQPGRAMTPRPTWRLTRGRTLARLVAPAVLIATAFGAGGQRGQPTYNGPVFDPQDSRLPDANVQMKMREENARRQNFEAINAIRRKELADETAKLFNLAAGLKIEMDKTNNDTLSLDVIRKAGEIEKLARDVKEKMKSVNGRG